MADELILMQYTEQLPIPELQPYIKCIWTLTATADEPVPVFERIFPDGHPELILHFGTAFEKRAGDQVYLQQSFFVYGQLSSYIELRPSANASVLGVRFEPYGLARFSQLPQYEMAGTEIDAGKVFPVNGLYHKLSSETGSERISGIQEFLLSLLAADHSETRMEAIRCVQQAVELIRGSEKSLSSVELAKLLHISSRELERRFREYIGLSPKQLAKIFRFQEVLQKKFITSTLTEIAHSSGYYDQSHFIRDFRAFSGLPPGEFFQQESGLTDFFISTEK